MPRRRPARAAGFCLTVMAAAALAVPGGAGARPAAGPPEPFHFELTTSEVCAFPMRIVYDGKVAERRLPGGATLVTAPGLHFTATNLDSGSSVRLMINGSAKVTDLPDGSARVVGHGPTGLFDPVLGFVVVRGNFSFTFDADGNESPVSGAGKVIDVCATLA